MHRRTISIIGTLTALFTAFSTHAAFFQQGDSLSVIAPVKDNLYPAPQRALTVRSGMNARKHVGKAGCGVPQGAPQVYAEKPRP